MVERPFVAGPAPAFPLALTPRGPFPRRTLPRLMNSFPARRPLPEPPSPRARPSPRSRSGPSPTALARRLHPLTRAESGAVKLKSKQEEIFEVEKEVACRSVTVKNMIEDTGLDTPVPLPMVDSKILIKVIEYCKYHHKGESDSLPEDEKNVWDKDFVKVDDETLFNLILAANYLDIKSLLDLTCKTVADEIKGARPPCRAAAPPPPRTHRAPTPPRWPRRENARGDTPAVQHQK